MYKYVRACVRAYAEFFQQQSKVVKEMGIQFSQDCYLIRPIVCHNYNKTYVRLLSSNASRESEDVITGLVNFLTCLIQVQVRARSLPVSPLTLFAFFTCRKRNTLDVC